MRKFKITYHGEAGPYTVYRRHWWRWIRGETYVRYGDALVAVGHNKKSTSIHFNRKGQISG